MAKIAPRSATVREQSHATSALTALARLLARAAARDAIAGEAVAPHDQRIVLGRRAAQQLPAEKVIRDPASPANRPRNVLPTSNSSTWLK